MAFRGLGLSAILRARGGKYRPNLPRHLPGPAALVHTEAELAAVDLVFDDDAAFKQVNNGRMGGVVDGWV
jgi:hypothetical protein